MKASRDGRGSKSAKSVDSEGDSEIGSTERTSFRNMRASTWATSVRLSIFNFDKHKSYAIWNIRKEEGKSRLYCTYLLPLTCLLYFMGFQVTVAGINGRLSVERFFLSLCVDDLIITQGVVRSLVVAGEVQRLGLFALNHVGFLHFALNMVALVWICWQLEADHGTLKTLTIFLVSTLCGSITSVMTSAAVSVGASAGILGLYGAKFAHLLLNWSVLRGTACLEGIVLFITVGGTFAAGLAPNVDNGSHLGGFLSGMCIGFSLLTLPRFAPTVLSNRDLQGKAHPEVEFNKKTKKQYQVVLKYVGGVLVFIYIAVSLALLYNGIVFCTDCLVGQTEDEIGNCTA